VIFLNADGTVGVKSEEKGTVLGTNPYEDHQSQYGSDVSATYVSLCLYCKECLFLTGIYLFSALWNNFIPNSSHFPECFSILH
jgi:hypothetical protein